MLLCVVLRPHYKMKTEVEELTALRPGCHRSSVSAGQRGRRVQLQDRWILLQVCEQTHSDNESHQMFLCCFSFCLLNPKLPKLHQTPGFIKSCSWASVSWRSGKENCFYLFQISEAETRHVIWTQCWLEVAGVPLDDDDDDDVGADQHCADWRWAKNTHQLITVWTVCDCQNKSTDERWEHEQNLWPDNTDKSLNCSSFINKLFWIIAKCFSSLYSVIFMRKRSFQSGSDQTKTVRKRQQYVTQQNI